jgi:carbonic anhydrase
MQVIEMSNSASTILAEIAQEVSRFPCVTFLDDVQLADGLLDRSIKNAAVVACSDMGGVPFLCGAEKNLELLLFQNFGHSCATGGLAITVVAEGIQNVVVYGHSDCEYTKFVAESFIERTLTDTARSSEADCLLQLYSAALESDSETLWEKIGQYNVLRELKGMLADPLLAPMAEKGNLKIHGWFLSSAESQLQVFDPKRQTFIAERPQLPDSLFLRNRRGEARVQED